MYKDVYLVSKTFENIGNKKKIIESETFITNKLYI